MLLCFEKKICKYLKKFQKFIEKFEVFILKKIEFSVAIEAHC